MKREIHEAASRKGGKWKVKKGIGTLPPEKRKQIASMGGKASHENKGKDRGKAEEDSGSNEGLLERILDQLE